MADKKSTCPIHGVRRTSGEKCLACRAEKIESAGKGDDHLLKYTRWQWVEMVTQLRFGSPTADIDLGQCQDMLDFLISKYWLFGGDAPKPRIGTHEVDIVVTTASDMRDRLPTDEWARKERAPHSDEGWPIFYEHNGVLMYLDGRRRLNKWTKEDPEMKILCWVVREI